MSLSAAEIRVENMVGTTDLNRELDLAALAEDMPDAEYDPQSFSGILYRLDDPEVTLQIFRTGLLICTGATNRSDIEETFLRLIEELREMGVRVDDRTEATVENIVASTDFDIPVELHTLSIELGFENVEYVPEQFSAVVYRLETDPNAVVLIFSNGKIVILGCKTLPEVRKAADVIQRKLSSSAAVGTV